MASSDARPVPRKGVAFRLYFPILDADGDLVSGATGLDSEISKDGGAFADCTNEATEIATSSGVYFLELSASEMDADAVCIIVKTSSVGAKTSPLILYPEEAGDFRADVTHFGGSAGTFAGGRPEVNASHAAGTAWNSGAIGAATLASDTITAAKIAADAITAAKIADGAIDAATFAAGAINAAAIAADAITDAKVAADVTIASVTGSVGSVTGAVGSVASGGISAASFAAGAINAAAIATDAIDADALAADAVTEIQSGLSTLTAAQVNSEVDTAIADARLDELLAADSDIDGAAPPTVGSVFHELLSKTAGSFTFDQTTDSLEAVRDNMGTPQTGDSFARLGAPAGASVSADIAAIEAQTDDIGTAGAGLTAVPWNAAWDAEVQSEVQDAIESNHLDHLLAVTYDPASKPGAADALLNELVESDAGVARYTANALEQAPTGGSAPTAAEIADAVWEEAIADHEGTVGSTAEALADAGGSGASAADIADAVWDEARADHVGAGSFGQGAASVQGNVTGSVASVTGAVGSVTGNVGGNVVGSVASVSGNVGGNVAGSVGSVTGNVGGNVSGNVSGSVGSVATGGISAGSFAAGAIDAAAIAADAIGSSELAASAVTEIQSGLATAASLTTVEGKVDTIDGIVDAIVVDTGTDIPALIDALPTATENATGVLDLAAGVEVGLTLRQALRLIAAASAGKLSGAATTTVVIRNAVADSKNRITATVDSDGNRDAVTVDLT